MHVGFGALGFNPLPALFPRKAQIVQSVSKVGIQLIRARKFSAQAGGCIALGWKEQTICTVK